MARAAIIIDCGYLPEQFPHIRLDVDTYEASAAVTMVSQLVVSYRKQMDTTIRVLTT